MTAVTAAAPPIADPQQPGFSKTPLPELRPAHARIVFQEFAPAEQAQRFIDVMPDLTSTDFRNERFTSVEDAIKAAHAFSAKDDRRAITVVRAAGGGGEPLFLLRPAMVVQSGGVHMGDAAKPAAEWRGDVDEVPRWHDTLTSASVGTLALAVRDANVGQTELSLQAIVHGTHVFDRTTGQSFWDPNHKRDLPWQVVDGAAQVAQ